MSAQYPLTLRRHGNRIAIGIRHTRGEALPQLLGLVGVLEDQRVEHPVAADLELVLVLVLLDPGGCKTGAMPLLESASSQN
jgi:hypothetical protein